MHPHRDGIIRSLDKTNLVLLYLVAYFLPISKAIIESASITAIFCLLIKKFMQRQDIPRTRINIPLFAYIAICFLSALLSTNLEISMRNFFCKYLQYFAFLFVVADTLNSERRIKNFIFIFLIASALLGSDGIFQYFTHKDFIRNRPFLYEGRISTTFATPNDYGCYLITALPFAIALSFYYNLHNNAKLRNLFVSLSLLLFACLLLTISKGAWYGFLVSLIFMSLWIRTLTLILIITVLFVLFTKQYYNNNLRYRLDHLFIIDSSGIGDAGSIDRKMIWGAAYRMFMSSPWIGVGLGTFMFNFKDFVAQSYQFSVPYAHNCYLQMASELGIIGLLVFLSILALFFIYGVKVLNTKSKTFTWYVSLATLAAVLAYCVQMSVDTVFYSLDLGIMFWIMLGLGAAVLQQAQSQNKKDTVTV